MKRVEKELYARKEECCGCGACSDACQAHAIRMVRDKEGFDYPYVDNSICVHCGRCEKVCPIKNSSSEKCSNQYLGAQAKDEKIRYSGSSGGVFSVLAEYVLERKGVVYGAGYNAHMEVIHQEADHLGQLERIKRTKYVQSSMQNIFPAVKQCLEEDRWVLFCGTPCQAQALKLFLGQEYDKLIVADLVCYGVPSPGIWRDYVRYLEKKYQGKMMEFSFRDKRNRDHGHTCSYVINDVEYVESIYDDPYCRMYFHNYILRPSCYQCKFCTVERSSDLTIGDFWGIENCRPDIDDGMGTSMMILHTDKARTIWDRVQGDMRWFECEKEDLLQPRLTKPVGMAKGRGLRILLYRKLPFSLFIRLMR